MNGEYSDDDLKQIGLMREAIRQMEMFHAIDTVVAYNSDVTVSMYLSPQPGLGVICVRDNPQLLDHLKNVCNKHADLKTDNVE